MARPSKNLTERLTIRLTEADKARLLSSAEYAGRDFATVARAQLLKAPLPRKARRVANADTEALARLLVEVNRMGGNLNQLAKVANTDRMVNLQTVRVIAEMQEKVASFREDLRRALQP